MVMFDQKDGSYDYFFSHVPGMPNTLIYQDSLNSFYNNQTNFFPAYFQTGKVLNANLQAYGGGTRASLMDRSGEEIAFLFDTLFYSMREGLAGVTFHFNRDLTDNVILRGIPLETARVLQGAPRKEMPTFVK